MVCWNDFSLAQTIASFASQTQHPYNFCIYITTFISDKASRTCSTSVMSSTRNAAIFPTTTTTSASMRHWKERRKNHPPHRITPSPKQPTTATRSPRPFTTTMPPSYDCDVVGRRHFLICGTSCTVRNFFPQNTILEASAIDGVLSSKTHW